jgi:lysophospholipase L1-like esterase
LGCGSLIRLIASSQSSPKSSSPYILLLAPPAITKPKNFMETVFENTESETKKFAKYYQSVAEYFKTYFMDTSEFINSFGQDGVHLDMKGNQILAERLVAKVYEIFK